MRAPPYLCLRKGCPWDFIAVAMLVGAFSIEACICVPQTAGEALDRASVIFLGRFIESETEHEVSVATLQTFELIEVFKGDASGQAQVNVRWWDCVPPTGRFPFRVGEEYVVYGRGDLRDGVVETSVCDRNLLRQDALVDLFHLRRLAASVRLGVRREGERMVFSIEGGEGQTFAFEQAGQLGEWTEIARVPVLNSKAARLPEVAFTRDQQFFRLREVTPRQGVFGIMRSSTEACEPMPSSRNEGALPRLFDYVVRQGSTGDDNACGGSAVAAFDFVLGGGRNRFIGVEHAPQLDEGHLGDAVIQALEEEGFLLGTVAQLQVLEPGREWRIVDSEAAVVLSVLRVPVGEIHERLRVSSGSTFRVPLPPGEFCLDGRFGCANSFEVDAWEWTFVELVWSFGR